MQKLLNPKKTITVGVPSAGQPRLDFINSLMELVISGLVHNVMIVPRLPIHQARQRIATQFDTSHLLFIDDDMVFTPLAVKLLIDANKDIVSGLYMQRSQRGPQPVVFRRKQGKYFWTAPPEVLSKVDATSLAFSLISKSVFLKVKPEFKFTETYGEDLDFMQRCTLSGFDIWLEPKAQVGHVMEVII